MRWNLMKAKPGTTKTVAKFAWWPVVLDSPEHEVVWLEKFYAVYYYKYVGSDRYKWICVRKTLNDQGLL